MLMPRHRLAARTGMEEPCPSPTTSPSREGGWQGLIPLPRESGSIGRLGCTSMPRIFDTIPANVLAPWCHAAE